jgi:hypothetical protein
MVLVAAHHGNARRFIADLGLTDSIGNLSLEFVPNSG